MADIDWNTFRILRNNIKKDWMYKYFHPKCVGAVKQSGIANKGANRWIRIPANNSRLDCALA